MSNIRSVWEIMSGSERSAEVPAEPGRVEALMTEPEAPTETSEAKTATAEPEAPQDCTAGALAPAPQRAYMLRSRKSIRTEERLTKALQRRNATKAAIEGSLVSMREEQNRIVKLSGEGEGWASEALDRVLGKIDVAQRKLAVFKEEADKAQAELENFRASVAALAPQRAAMQDNLAQLAGARLELDHELEKLLREARAILEVREQTVSLMRQQAAAIELTGSFDAGVPPSMRETLSLEIVSASQSWNARFLGEGKGLKAYVVSGESFEPEETLTRKAIYHFGEVVWLLEEEAVEFLRNDRAKPDGRGWECLPPTLMTAEAFAAAQAESGRTGPMLRYVLERRHSELEQKRFEAFKLERRGTPVPGAHLRGR